MKFKRMFLSLTFAIGVIMGSTGYVAAADFHIDDGAPDYWMSPGIIAQQTYQDPPTGRFGVGPRQVSENTENELKK
jgi:hypothetical protein